MQIDSRIVIIHLDDGNGNSTKIGFVRAKNGASYADLREEIQNDELEGLMDYAFVFLAEHKLPLSKKQETRFKIMGNEVFVRLTDDKSIHPSKRPRRVMIDELEEEVNLHNDVIEVISDTNTEQEDTNGNDTNKGISLCENKMQSKLATKVELFKWKKDIRLYTTKFRNAGRQDRFELMTVDVNGRAVFSIWCTECNISYGKGNRDTMWNFSKHCKTKLHQDNYQRNHMESVTTINLDVDESLEDIVEQNKVKVEQSLLNIIAPFVEQSGVVFELYKDSVAGYQDLSSICIVCKLCNKSILLFPPIGSVVVNMKQHIQSSRHVQNAAAKEAREKKAEEPNKGGRPQKNQPDPRQTTMLTFITRATSSRTNGEGSSDQTRNACLASLCWGYWQMQYRYASVTRDLRPFLDDSRPGSNWYCEPNLQGCFNVNAQSVSIDGTFRHNSCRRVSSDGKPFTNYQCSYCCSIPKEHDFRMRVGRQEGKTPRGWRMTKKGRRLDYMTNREIYNVAKDTVFINRKLKKELWFTKIRVVALSAKRRSMRDSLSESMHRKDVKKFCGDIVEAHSQGKFDGKPALWNFLTDIAHNIIRPGQGKRYKKTTKELFETVKIWGGRRMHNFLSLNLAGPSLSTTMRSARESFIYRVGVREDTFVHLARTYAKHMKDLNLEPGHVPASVAEDETVIKKTVQWFARDDGLVGFCGKQQDHACDAAFVVTVGSGETGYQNIVQAFANNVVARYARVLIVNPLHAQLPKLVLVIQLTCNKFDHKFVRSQWEEIGRLWDIHLKQVLGPLIGHSSDGDARRRKCMLQDYTSLKRPTNCFRIHWEGWGFTASIRNDGSVYGLHDQDFIHNGKKLINPLDNASRRLNLGNELVTLNDVWHVFNLCHGEHGLQIGDIERKDRQNWRAAQRIASRRVQFCLCKLRNDINSPQIRTLGTETYLFVVSLYIDIFLSPHMSLRSRIKAASTVSFFFRIWRLWILNHDTYSLAKNFISRETFMDIQMSCHFAVLLIKYFRDHCKDLPVPLHSTGSDACENFFSKVGGMVRNERSYSGADLIESAKALNKVAEFQALSDLLFPAAHAKQENIWQVLERQVDEDGNEVTCDLSDHSGVSTDEEIINVLEEGLLLAKGLCNEVGIVCNGNETWWDKPWQLEDYFHSNYYMQLDCCHIEDESDIVQAEDADMLQVEDDVQVGDAFESSSMLEHELSHGNVYGDEIIAEMELRHAFDEMLDKKELEKDIKVDRLVQIDDKKVCKATLISHLNGNPWLSKDRLTRVKNHVYCNEVGKKINAATSLGIGSDCAVYFEVEKAEVLKRKRGGLSGGKALVWYVGRVLSIRRKTGKAWRESREPIDLTSRPSYCVELNLAWYEEHKDRNSTWFSYDLSDLQLISLDSIISLACMVCKPETHRYYLDRNDRCQFDKFLTDQQTEQKGKTKIV